MKKDIKSLIESKKKWESDIVMYKKFLEGETQTFEGRYGAKEYISMAENRLNDIKKKLKEIESKS
tara:strand:+ start:18 stop:212 length:195 start_codon:yes stop_codon:yes gene_type:complete